METMDQILRYAVELNASDIHMKKGNPPILRIDGELKRHGEENLTGEQVHELLDQICAPADMKKFDKVLELDSSYIIEGVARFRINACKGDGHTRIVLRMIPLKIYSIDEMKLPQVLKKALDARNGIILVTGITGSGKSTTLAAMINEINITRAEHIVTVEDPIEFVHEDKKSFITQREVGHDTLSFQNALRGALRQDPDVILIGEMRDTETVRTGLASAETGHLVFSTLHTVDAVETIHRIIDFFEPHAQEQVRKQIAATIRATISQRILPKKDGKGRIAACEILLGTRTIKDFIEAGKGLKDIHRLIEEGYKQYGMQTFDQAIYDLWKKETIDEATALSYASSTKDLKLRMQGFA